MEAVLLLCVSQETTCAGTRMEFCRWSRSLTLLTWSWVMAFLLWRADIPSKSMTGGFSGAKRNTLHCSYRWCFMESEKKRNLECSFFFFCFSILGRIIKISPEVLAYREWTIKKWGAKQYGKVDNHGKFGWISICGCHLRCFNIKNVLLLLMLCL